MNRTTLVERLRSGPFQRATETGPLYINLAHALRELIERRWLTPGEALPPERELALGLSIGRVTVRNAYKRLLSSGDLEIRQGSGTFVASKAVHIEQPLSNLSSFSEDMRQRRMEPGASVLNSGVAPPSPDEMFLFGVDRGEPMLHLDRLRLADGVPVAVERAVVPWRYAGGAEIGESSLYRALSGHGYRPVRATQKLTSTIFGAVEAQLLGVEPGAPCLLIERVSRTADQRVVEHTRSHYRGDIYDFVAELTIGD